MQIEYYRDRRDEWRWRLKSANGAIRADSAEGYASLANVKHAASDMIAKIRERDSVIIEVVL
jgi:uncharacterized protein YegP (UPF0339 family)